MTDSDEYNEYKELVSELSALYHARGEPMFSKAAEAIDFLIQKAMAEKLNGRLEFSQGVYEAERQNRIASETTCRNLGYEPRQLQLKWRDDPPVFPDDPPPSPSKEYSGNKEEWEKYWALPIHAEHRRWQAENNAAVVDALVHEGVNAWPGDATGCVDQIIRAFAVRERNALKKIKELEEVIKNAKQN